MSGVVLVDGCGIVDDGFDRGKGAGVRRSWTVAAAGIVAAVAVAGGGWLWENQPKYDVPVPPGNAGPDDVVRAYVRALDAHDGATARALSTSDHRAVTRSWLADTSGMKALSVSAPVTEGSRVQVAVVFDLHQHWWTDDPSMRPGHHTWNYILVHREGRWLIQDEGTG
jgi:hypothetical protein